MPDEQLVTDYIDGNEKAVEVLVDRHLSSAYTFALKLTHDEHAAEDIAQESFVKAWKNIRTWKRKSSFKTWLFTITRNLAMDWLRKRTDMSLSDFDTEEGNMVRDTIADEAPLQNELLSRSQDVEYIQKLLIELDPTYSEVLKLRYYESLTFEKIGQILKRPLHTVKSQHRRALIALRRAPK